MQSEISDEERRLAERAFAEMLSPHVPVLRKIPDGGAVMVDDRGLYTVVGPTAEAMRRQLSKVLDHVADHEPDEKNARSLRNMAKAVLPEPPAGHFWVALATAAYAPGEGEAFAVAAIPLRDMHNATLIPLVKGGDA